MDKQLTFDPAVFASTFFPRHREQRKAFPAWTGDPVLWRASDAPLCEIYFWSKTHVLERARQELAHETTCDVSEVLETALLGAMGGPGELAELNPRAEFRGLLGSLDVDDLFSQFIQAHEQDAVSPSHDADSALRGNSKSEVLDRTVAQLGMKVDRTGGRRRALPWEMYLRMHEEGLELVPVVRQGLVGAELRLAKQLSRQLWPTSDVPEWWYAYLACPFLLPSEIRMVVAEGALRYPPHKMSPILIASRTPADVSPETVERWIREGRAARAGSAA